MWLLKNCYNYNHVCFFPGLFSVSRLSHISVDNINGCPIWRFQYVHLPFFSLVPHVHSIFSKILYSIRQKVYRNVQSLIRMGTTRLMYQIEYTGHCSYVCDFLHLYKCASLSVLDWCASIDVQWIWVIARQLPSLKRGKPNLPFLYPHARKLH